ncbi:hypothetical protein [Enterobacter sichuanensis]|uniref:hypothetical protein n=1 Tax=Enterobacter sichuanensis TaxID=2071710 RepID=UPI001FBB648D|nr:hypothetical protein [Enterobacter sichuanensis]
MQNSVAINQPIKTPQMLFGSDNINDFGNRVQSCRMEGDSMQPTIEPCEVVAFVDCGGHALPLAFMFTQWMLLVAHAFSLRESSH